MVVRRRFLVLIALTLPVAAIISTVTLTLRGSGSAVGDTVRAPATADVFLRDARLAETAADGSIIYRLNAADAIYYNDRSVELRDVVIRHFGPDGGAWVVTAETGYIPPSEKNIRLAGNVKMNGTTTRGEPVEVATDELWVRTVREVLETDAPVEILSADRRVTATGMTTDWKAGSVRLNRKVRATYRPGQSGR